MAQFDLKFYARRGAEARLAELREEMNAIHAAFPDLRRGRPAAKADVAADVPTRRRRKGMSATARKAVSDRMKKYWAARRKEKKTK